MKSLVEVKKSPNCKAIGLLEPKWLHGDDAKLTPPFISLVCFYPLQN